ncbi:hypothetical protein FHS32_004974 [Streptomyces albaduncus]|uniref:Transposase n=1 Tax=Streptomyces griseoloalbus TaxID=67303 RepID=A0A7W8BRD4_9ACTN|nr:hypothetical protein [Streptomyces albaduncus]
MRSPAPAPRVGRSSGWFAGRGRPCSARGFLRELLKKTCSTPRAVVTDKPRSYGVAHREVIASVEHRAHRCCRPVHHGLTPGTKRKPPRPDATIRHSHTRQRDSAPPSGGLLFGTGRKGLVRHHGGSDGPGPRPRCHNRPRRARSAGEVVAERRDCRRSDSSSPVGSCLAERGTGRGGGQAAGLCVDHDRARASAAGALSSAVVRRGLSAAGCPVQAPRWVGEDQAAARAVVSGHPVLARVPSMGFFDDGSARDCINDSGAAAGCRRTGLTS